MKALLLLIVLPLLAAFLLPIVNRVWEPAGRWLGPLVLVVTTIIGLRSWGLLDGGTAAFAMSGIAPPLGVTLYVDQMALIFAILVSVGTLVLWPWGDSPGAGTRQYTLTLILAGAGAGLALSGDLFNIYVFYELLAMASYGLAAGRLTGPAFAATMRFFVVSAFGAALALIGITLIYQATGTLNLAHLAELAPTRLDNLSGMAAFVLILLGFGVKAELFPVNIWVPDVYATAPRRVSGLLAGVVSKLALLVIVRLVVLVFQQPELLAVMLMLGILGVVSGEIAAWRARDFNRMLAYSSIGQLGIVFIAFSIPGEAGILAGMAVALHHMLVKPALFLLAERWGGALDRLAGIARVSPLGAALFVLFALSLVGVPPLPGFWAKLLVITGLFAQSTPLYGVAVFAVLATTVVEAGYMFRLAASFYGKTSGEPLRHQFRDIGTASVLGVVLLLGVAYLSPLGDRLSDAARQAADVEVYIDTVAPRLPPR